MYGAAVRGGMSRGRCYSFVQRKVLTSNDFTDFAQVEQRLLAFQDRYNATAAPFKWKFTAADLTRLLARIKAHEDAAHEPASLPRAA